MADVEPIPRCAQLPVQLHCLGVNITRYVAVEMIDSHTELITESVIEPPTRGIAMNKSLLVLTLLGAPALANEGMWMPQQLPQLEKELKATGLELDPARLTQLTE